MRVERWSQTTDPQQYSQLRHSSTHERYTDLVNIMLGRKGRIINLDVLITRVMAIYRKINQSIVKSRVLGIRIIDHDARTEISDVERA